MSRGGAAPKTVPVGWVFLYRAHEECVTIRWRRGEPFAYVLAGNRLGDHTSTGTVGKIPVASAGWTDLAEIKLVGQRWLRQQ